MPKRNAEERLKDFKDVNLGYRLNEAVEEALRCEQCEEPTCIKGCPIDVDIPGFIKCIRNKDAKSAAEIIKKNNYLPGVCGRVCPQEKLCEGSCKLAEDGAAISIGYLERFAADNEDNIFIMPEKIPKSSVSRKPKKKMKVAVVGSGPSGLTCAAELASRGYSVEIYEGLHDTGGVLRYGIPEFRLPKQVLDLEIDNIKKLGVSVHLNHIIGKTISVDDLQKEFAAVFIGTGAGLPNLPKISGEHLNGVVTANEYLTRINLMKAYRDRSDTPLKNHNRVIVIGGGNTAMDCARVAKRLGSEVALVYRKSYNDMTVRREDFIHAKDEGINFIFLTNPVRIIGKSKVEGVELIQMMTEIDEDENKKSVPLENTEFVMDCDQVIFAIGQGPNPMITRTTKIAHRYDQSIVVDGKFRTSKKNVFAGGDAIGGDATVIQAMADGRMAAQQIDELLFGE